MRRVSIVATMVVALIFSIVGGATANHIELPTDPEATDWTPVDGTPFASWEIVDGELHADVVQEEGRASGREGLKTPTFADPVDEISVDLYLDSSWEGPVALQFMGQVEGATRTWPMLEFARVDGFEGFRYFRSWAGGHSAGASYGWAAQNTLEELGIGYDEWVTLTVRLDRETNHATYAVNGIPVGGDSYVGADIDGISHAFLLTENFAAGVDPAIAHRYDIGDLTPHTYTARWRGLDAEPLFDPSDAEADDHITLDVHHQPQLEVEMAIAGPGELPVDEAGEYEVTVRNKGLGLDQSLENWNLGLEVERITSLNELTLEFCESNVNQSTGVATRGTCYDIDDITGAEARLVSGNIIQVVGAGEDTIRPGHSDQFFFRATFHNAGQFTGTVYVLTDQ